MNLPRVLIVSTAEGKAADIARCIGSDCLSDENGIQCFLWKIDNKYYASQVLICTMEDPFAKVSYDGIEALIVHHDPQTESVEEDLEKWSSVLSSLAEAEVLLFSSCQISDVQIREKLMKWCLRRKFELVEWIDSSDNTDTDHEKHGIERIIEALHAHTWPNMILKGRSIVEENSSEVNQVVEQFEGIDLTQDPTERLRMESVLDGIMGGEDADFGELFGQIRAMKELIATLPTNQRRVTAEQLLIAFWKAMGGDPAEIDD